MSGRYLCESRLIFWGQNLSTCWFNTILATAFYSDGVRKRLLNASNKWSLTVEIYRIFKHILDYKYIKSNMPEDDFEFFERMTPQKILGKLNAYNNVMFPLTNFNRGYKSHYYIKQMYDLFQIDSLMFTLHIDGTVAYDVYNHITNFFADDNTTLKHKPDYYHQSIEYIQAQLQTTPDILFVRFETDKIWHHYYRDIYHYILHQDSHNANNIRAHYDELIYNNSVYSLDAVIVDNWNNSAAIGGHSVAGVSCRGNRYLYNSQLVEYSTGEHSRRPCDLMRFDWNLHERDEQKKYFFIQTSYRSVNDEDYYYKPKCEVGFGIRPGKKSYSFCVGRRILIYVKQRDITPESPLPDNPPIPEHIHWEFSSPESESYDDFNPDLQYERLTLRQAASRASILSRTARAFSESGRERVSSRASLQNTPKSSSMVLRAVNAYKKYGKRVYKPKTPVLQHKQASRTSMHHQSASRSSIRRHTSRPSVSSVSRAPTTAGSLSPQEKRKPREKRKRKSNTA